MRALLPVEQPATGTVYFPGDGVYDHGVLKQGTSHGFDSTGCFE